MREAQRLVPGLVLLGLLLGGCSTITADSSLTPSGSGETPRQVRTASPVVSVTSVEIGSASPVLPEDCPESDFAGGSGPDYVVGALRKYGGIHQDTYAGLWGYGGGFRVAFTDDLHAHGDRLRDAVKGRVRIELVRARWTLRELNDLDDQIVQRIGREVADRSISAVGVFEQHNRVGITLSSVNDEVRQALAEQYPADMLCLQQGVFQPVDLSPSRHSSAPSRGGE